MRKASQKFILIEGFCNSSKFIFDSDKLEMRYMDEFFNIEKSIGEIIAVIGLQFNYEKEYIEDNEIEYEVFPEPEVVVPKKREDGDEELEDIPPVQDDDDEKKVPKF